jgi:hypothetical protein
MYKLIGLLIVFFLADFTSAQQDVNYALDYTLSYRGLSREDVTTPIDFFDAAEKSPTNDAKLILPIVRDMMINPLRSMTWIDSVSEFDKQSVDSVLITFFKYLDYDTSFIPFTTVGNFYDLENNKDLLSRIVRGMRGTSHIAAEMQWRLLNYLNQEEIKIIDDDLLSIFEEEDDNDTVNVDIFKYNQMRDSSIAISKKVVNILNEIDKKRIYQNNINLFGECWRLYNYMISLKDRISKLKVKHIDNEYCTGDFIYYNDSDSIRVAIGSTGNNYYHGKFDFIIDLGGDDHYDIDMPDNSVLSRVFYTSELDLIFRNFTKSNFSCIIDLSGNDYYTTKSNFALAGALFSSSFIFDKEGDDYYNCRSVGLGAAIGGLGLLYDESGNDTYHGLTFSIGAGCFGVGLVVDRKGNDTYIANSYSQGFGMTAGVGAIIDNEGNDAYLIDARSLDIGRYEDHYVSMCQGYGLGLRPYYAGGIGLIIEGSGNDIYNTDIFGQGGAYWYSMGVLIDKSGHDKYNGYQYSQGAGIHLAVGLLKDYDGWDFYQSQGVSQGCGHDFGFGLLWDVKGNDNYSAYSLSQGAGNADGIGILIDESGSDGYLSKEPVYMSKGYGNPRREYGSIGLFLDMSGNDFYSEPGPDSTLYNSSTWGVRNDYFLKDTPEQVSGDNFKVALDTVKTIKELPSQNSFTIEQCFIMASTIEPRFSEWQEYGFERLAHDSTEAAQYVLTRLGTDDARAVQVMRVLSRRMGTALNDAIVNRLKDYIDKEVNMTQAEVSLACYLLGEIGIENGKDILLGLTYDDNIRVRSSAINALGKIKIDSVDSDFRMKVSDRLIELVNENPSKKLYNKDIAYAFSKYPEQQNLDALINLLSYNFYGARFLAAGALKEYWKTYGIPENNILLNIELNKLAFQAFLYSLIELPDEKFKPLIEQILTLAIASDEIVNMNLIDLLKSKKNKSIDENYISYYNELLANLETKSEQKVK